MANSFDTKISIVETAIEAECGKSHILPTHKLDLRYHSRLYKKSLYYIVPNTPLDINAK